MDGFCRACLIKFDDPAELLPYTEKNRRLYVYSTGLQVKRTDLLTFELCKECYINMKCSCKFKKQCRTSDKRYRNYLALKEAGDTVDFCTFLKNNDDSFMFRLPLLASGNSTPAFQRNRDDDNESTCTSIRNFMSDILPTDEIPATEARIIREVIEEEADVLDDSLDSHWLQDDVSIDNDFRLDFSFSPFSTPHSVNNERCFTPQKLKEQLIDPTPLNVAKKLMQDQPEETNSTDSIVRQIINTETLKEPLITYQELLQDDQEVKTLEEKQAIPTIGNFYQELDLDVKENTEKVCTIDRNLEEALKKNDAKEYLLNDIISTPPVLPNVSAPSTPTISNILFGDKLDDENSNFKSGQRIEKYVDMTGDYDIYEEFFYNETKEFDSNDIAIYNKSPDQPEFKEPIGQQYDMTDFSCKICDKKFKKAVALKVHFTKIHKIKIVYGPKKCEKYNRVLRLCDYCGKSFHDFPNLIKHIKRHLNPKPTNLKCERCLSVLPTESSYKMHINTHVGMVSDNKKQVTPSHICSICGFATTSVHKLRIHMRRHAKDYKHTCEQCSKGFVTKSDLVKHIRVHNADKPFACTFCAKNFSRRDTLSRHLKYHTGEVYRCKFCNATFHQEPILLKHMKTSKSCIKVQTQIAVIEQASKIGGQTYFVIKEENRPVSTPTNKKRKVNLPEPDSTGQREIAILSEVNIETNAVSKDTSVPVVDIMKVLENPAVDEIEKPIIKRNTIDKKRKVFPAKLPTKENKVRTRTRLELPSVVAVDVEKTILPPINEKNDVSSTISLFEMEDIQMLDSPVIKLSLPILDEENDNLT